LVRHSCRTCSAVLHAAALVAIVAASVLYADPAAAQEPLARLTLDDAVTAALASNPTLRAKMIEVSSVRANEITAGLIPNP
jgi:outer membrane protein TolC